MEKTRVTMNGASVIVYDSTGRRNRDAEEAGTWYHGISDEQESRCCDVPHNRTARLRCMHIVPHDFAAMYRNMTEP